MIFYLVSDVKPQREPINDCSCHDGHVSTPTGSFPEGPVRFRHDHAHMWLDSHRIWLAQGWIRCVGRGPAAATKKRKSNPTNEHPIRYCHTHIESRQEYIARDGIIIWRYSLFLFPCTFYLSRQRIRHDRTNHGRSDSSGCPTPAMELFYLTVLNSNRACDSDTIPG